MNQRKEPAWEAWEHFQREYGRLLAARASRRLVLKVGTLASLGGSAAMAELVAACTSGGGSELGLGTERLVEGAYKYSPFQYEEKYNWRDLPWDKEPNLYPYTGGHIQESASPPSNYDLKTGTFYTVGGRIWQGLMHNGGFGKGADFSKGLAAPDLASAMRVAPDLSYYDFDIPDNVVFHNMPPVNGRKLRVDDVKYSFEFWKNASIFTAALADVDRFETRGNTFRIYMKKPVFEFPLILASPYYWVFAPEHFEGSENAWQQQPIGTGPWVITYSKFQDHRVGQRHPEYRIGGRRDDPRWAGVNLPFADKLTSWYFADTSARKSAFRSRQLDHFGFVSNGTDFDDLVATNPDAFAQVYFAHFTTHLRIVPQQKTKEWADVRFRRAVSMAINRNEVIENAYSNFAAPPGIVAWDILGRKADPLLEELGPYYQYNPAEARRLLQEAGYAPGSVEVQYHATGESNFALLMQKYLEDVGIRLKLDVQQSTVLSTMRTRKNYTGFVTSDTVTGMSVIWELVNFYDPESPTNWGGINDQVLWDYVQKAKYATSIEEERRWLLEVERHEKENLNDIYVVSVGNGGIWQPWLGNVANNVRNTITASGSWALALAWMNDKAPEGRAGKRAL